MAAYTGSPDGALSLIELAQVRSDRLTHSTRAMLCTLRAQYLSVVGRIGEALSEVARADGHMAQRTPDSDPAWMCYYDEAEHLGSTGKALIPVAIARNRMDLAHSRLQRAIELQKEDYPRSRVFSLIRLATLFMRIDDARMGADLGRRAIGEADGLCSRRVRDELACMAEACAPHRRISEVNELHHTITATTRPGIGS